MGLQSFTYKLVEYYYRRIKVFIPTIAKICLLSTFIEDSLRMYIYFSAQV
jgi:hypothetical protein